MSRQAQNGRQPSRQGDSDRGVELRAVEVAVETGGLPQLRRRKRELAKQVAALTWDLGGLAYEMAIRDHYRLDVIARKAAELQQADAQLSELQRLLARAEGGIEAQCRSCGAFHGRGAGYCWRCGAPLLREARPAPLDDAASGAT